MLCLNFMTTKTLVVILLNFIKSMQSSISLVPNEFAYINFSLLIEN